MNQRAFGAVVAMFGLSLVAYWVAYQEALLREEALRLELQGAREIATQCLFRHAAEETSQRLDRCRPNPPVLVRDNDGNRQITIEDVLAGCGPAIAHGGVSTAMEPVLPVVDPHR
jgi:hypothetical protein